MLIISLEPPS